MVSCWMNWISWLIYEFNKTKQHLTDGEETSVVDYAVSLTNYSFPFSHDWVKEYVNDILEAWHGPHFSGIGKKWLSQFLMWHSDILQPLWSHALDHSYAWAINPIMHNMFFDILEATVISCLSRQYLGLYLSPTLPTLLPASDIPDRCTIGGLLHDYRNPPPTDYFRIFPTIHSILQPGSLSTTPPAIWAPTSLLPTSATHQSRLIMTVATTDHCHTRLPILDQ